MPKKLTWKRHGRYKGCVYGVLYAGPTIYGERAHLSCTDGSESFWCDASQVEMIELPEKTAEQVQRERLLRSQKEGWGPESLPDHRSREERCLAMVAAFKRKYPGFDDERFLKFLLAATPATQLRYLSQGFVAITGHNKRRRRRESLDKWLATNAWD